VWGDATIRRRWCWATCRTNPACCGGTWAWPAHLPERREAPHRPEYEGSPGDRSYFRTSLNDYQRARIQARYQALASLLLTAHFGVLKNENPAPGVNFDYLSRDNTLSAYWTRGGKTAEYPGGILADHPQLGHQLPGPGHRCIRPVFVS